VIGPAGTVTSYEYNDTHDAHNLTKQTIDGQFVFNYAYDDENDRCIESTGPEGKLRVALDYQPDVNRTVVTDGNGQVHTKYYNSHGRIVRVVHADSREETFTWDADLNRTGVVRQDGSEWQYEYDDRGNLTKTVDPAGGEVVMTYDADDNLTGLTDERGNTTQYQYDDNGNVTSIAQADDSSLAFTYNDRGQVLTATDAGGDATSYNYDESGNLISVTDPEGNSITYAYDAVGRRISSMDAEGNTTRYTYDAMNRVTSVTDALSGEVETQHETAGLGNLTDQNRNTTQFHYDAVDQLTEIIDPLGNTKSFGYDANGNLASRTDFKGQETAYEYDEMDLLTKIDYPAGTDVTFEYDALGRVTGMTDATGTSAYAYDSAGRLSSYTNGFDKTVSYTYDAAGNLVTLTYPGDKSVSYAYDERNRLTQIEDWAGRRTTYAYDNSGRLVQTTLPNGTRVEYEYDAAGKLTALRNLRSDDSVIASYEYTFDGNGNIIGANSDQPLDPVLQTQVVNTIIGPDNRIASTNGTAFTYDDNGNLTSDASTTYDYDYEDRLTRVASPDNGTWEYLYDGAGRRVQSMHDSEVCRFLLDPRGMTNVLAEYDGDGNLTAYYVHGLGLAYKVDASGDAYSYHYNYAGHTVAMTDGDGDIVNKYAYLPFGELAAEDEMVDNPFRYVGKYGVMDEGNGLLFMRARYLHLGFGRFVSRDPIGLADDFNMYEYADNNPFRFVDPMGLCKGEHSSEGSWFSILADFQGNWGIIKTGWRRVLRKREQFINSKLGQTLKEFALLWPGWTAIELNWDEETGELKGPKLPKEGDPDPLEKIIRVWQDPHRPLW
jgi:RHS repeat-associated protein